MQRYKTIYIFNDFTLDPSARKLYRRLEPVKLSSHAFDILRLLIENRDRAMRKDELLNRIWDDAFVEESNLAVHIHMLRRLLGEKRGENKFIATVSGHGYQFVAPVTEKISDEPPLTAQHNQPAKEAFGHPLGKIYSLVVLPFSDLNLPASLEYLPDGLTESLIRDLSLLPQLKVIARSAVWQYRNQPFNFAEIGFLLGAEAILTGQILPIKGRLKVSVELINAVDQSHIWGAGYDFHADDLVKIKNEISLAIAENLRASFGVDSLQTALRQTSDSEAYRWYLKGRYALDKKTKKGFYKGIEFFQKALKSDPGYSLAYTGIADAYFVLYLWYQLSAEESVPQAKRALEKALALDDSVSEAWASKGQIQYRYEYDWAGAERSFKRALSINPNNSLALRYYSACLSYSGRFQESLTILFRALELEPNSLSANLSLAGRYFIAREYGKSIAVAEDILEMEPNTVFPLAHVAASYAKLGLYDIAIDKINEQLAALSSPELVAIKGWILALAGETDEAREILAGLLAESPPSLVDHCDIAIIYHALNENEKALEYLEKGIDMRSPNSCTIKVDPRLEGLRADERFQALLKRIGFGAKSR